MKKKNAAALMAAAMAASLLVGCGGGAASSSAAASTAESTPAESTAESNWNWCYHPTTQHRRLLYAVFFVWKDNGIWNGGRDGSPSL